MTNIKARFAEDFFFNFIRFRKIIYTEDKRIRLCDERYFRNKELILKNQNIQLRFTPIIRI